MISLPVYIILALTLSSMSCLFSVDGQNYFSSATPDPNCVEVFPAKNLNIMWALRMFGGQDFYLPMGNTEAFTDLAEMLKGNSTEPMEKTTMCPEATIRGFQFTVKGFQKNFMVHDCALIRSGIQDCKVNNISEFPAIHAKADAIQTLVWTDNETGIIMVRCAPAGKNDWTLYSTQKFVDEETKKMMFAEISKLGLNTNDVYYTPYDSCV